MASDVVLCIQRCHRINEAVQRSMFNKAFQLGEECIMKDPTGIICRLVTGGACIVRCTIVLRMRLIFYGVAALKSMA